MKNFVVPDEGDVLYLYCFGDQHHEDCNALKAGKKVISDGGSNIHTNLLLYIQHRFKIAIFTYKDNYQVRNFFGGLSNIRIKEFFTLSGFFRRYLLRIETVTRCLFPGLLFLFRKLHYTYVMTQTDFLPDTFAAFCLKLRNPSIEWIASFFLAAPSPWDSNAPYRGRRWIIGFFYWLLQKPSILFIQLKADKILVTSEPDVRRFLGKRRSREEIIVVQGGVEIKESEEYLRGGNVIPLDQRKYDACFVGRFHYQKGVIELIGIWDHVCRVKKDAALAMIGAGPLEKDIRAEIRRRKLDRNIALLGFKDGQEKYEIFKQSKVMVHPAMYDSGGMAMAGGMAWGLPGVSFDLEALKTYYPKGVLKTPRGNTKQFAENVMKLLHEKSLYEKVAKEAHDLITDVWDWDKRLKDVSRQLFA